MLELKAITPVFRDFTSFFSDQYFHSPSARRGPGRIVGISKGGIPGVQSIISISAVYKTYGSVTVIKRALEYVCENSSVDYTGKDGSDLVAFYNRHIIVKRFISCFRVCQSVGNVFAKRCNSIEI